MSFRNLHPTAAALVKTCDQLLNTKRADQISTEELIEKAGVSKGSMYHHFEDLKDLIEITFIYRFSKWVDLTIDKISGLLTTAKTAEELKNSLFIVTKLTQQNAQSVIRVERAWIYSEAHKNKRFEGRLRKEAERLTSALEDLVADVINKGLFKPDLNPRVVAIFIQAYTLGVIVNDFTENPISEEQWIDFINSVIENMFINQ
jgi:AcrR family transcriptional regulator